MHIYIYIYIFQVYIFLGSLGAHVNTLKSRALLCVEDKIFTPHDFISLATCTTSILSWILGKSISKPKRAHNYQKRRQSLWSNTHGDFILSKPMVQAHGTSSHFQLMIQAHESHRGNFGSCGLEDQEVRLVKLQRFKIDKENMLLDMSSSIP